MPSSLRLRHNYMPGYTLAATAIAATEGSIAICYSIGATSDICRSRERTQSSYESLRLRQSTQLKLCSLQLITQFLNGILSHERTSCITISLNSVNNVTSVTSILITNCVNVTISLTAALLCIKPSLVNVLIYAIKSLAKIFLNSIESIKHTSISSIETITQTILNTTY